LNIFLIFHIFASNLFIVFNMKNIFILLTLIASAAHAQTINWTAHAKHSYVFEISDKEAVKLLKRGSSEGMSEAFLHTLVATLSDWEKNKPDRGHFIVAEIDKDRVRYSYTPIIPFQVFMFKQYGMLTLQVVDENGKIRSNAKVKLNRGRISYDAESKTYSADNMSERREHILTVRLDGFTAVFDVTKHIVNPWYNYGGGGSTPDFYSYMITDKNKYKPGETVRFKSYALSGNRRPLRGELSVWTYADNRAKRIGTVQAHRPGGFAGEFVLHDTLKLKLDKRYPLQLRDKSGRIAASTFFYFEDYELYDNRLQVQMQSRSQYYPEANRLEISTTDANGLFLQGMQADITVKRRTVFNTYADVLLLPDTLLHRRIELDADKPTVFEIPHTLFGEADCLYDVEVVALSFDNQRMEWRDAVSFYRSHYSISHKTHGDTIRFEFYELGKERAVTAELSYNGDDDPKTVQLPYEEKFDQTTDSYNIRVLQPKYSRIIATSDIVSGLNLTGGFKADSFNVKLVNPLQLDVSWYVYHGSSILQKGAGKELDFKSAEADYTSTYYVEIFYFMGKEEKVYRRVFTPQADYLSVNLDIPERIYPGQTVDASIRVSNNMGNPVSNVDLTAFGYNSLLNRDVPDLPYYGDPPNVREKRSSYSMRKRLYTYSSGLKFEFWNSKLKLDSSMYYQFTYPLGKMFTHAVSAPDSVTQFAPYVMRNGRALTVYAVEIDDKPVYFSWTQQPKAYSFPCDTFCREISLRLYDRVIILHNVRFERGKKTIISLDVDNLPATERPKIINLKFFITVIKIPRENYAYR
jgi:hypothetical protein